MKFKIGDKVKCIGKKVSASGNTGTGWKLGLEFKIKDISASDTKYPIYWPGNEGNGVYEDQLQLANLNSSDLTSVIENVVADLGGDHQ